MNTNHATFELAKKASLALEGHCPFDSIPKIAVVLGSGFRSFASSVEVTASIPFSDIPGFFSPSVAGHGSELIFGKIDKTPLVLLTGRCHLYEGYTSQQVAHPIRSLANLGLSHLILTNASGGLKIGMKPGQLVVIKDHINLTGQNCLIGLDALKFGRNFIDMTQAYDSDWIRRFKESFNQTIPECVYAGVIGPSYETPAETMWLSSMSADLVGMSTVQECIAARQMNVKVMGLSLVTNLAGGLNKGINHQEVLDAGKAAEQVSIKALRTAINVIRS